jgi:hypothetical protein
MMQAEVGVMRSKLVMPVLIAIAAMVGCDGSDGSDDLSQYRCLGHNADGSCVSTPANCPLRIQRTTPFCGEGYTLILTKDDTCPNRLICID